MPPLLLLMLYDVTQDGGTYTSVALGRTVYIFPLRRTVNPDLVMLCRNLRVYPLRITVPGAHVIVFLRVKPILLSSSIYF